jgi:hypothetical protein
MSGRIRFVPLTNIRREMEIAQWFVRQQLLQPSRFALARRNEMARLSLSLFKGRCAADRSLKVEAGMIDRAAY